MSVPINQFVALMLKGCAECINCENDSRLDDQDDSIRIEDNLVQ